jgi:transposase
MPFVAAPVTIDDETRSVLEARVAAHTTSQRDAKRARTVLLAADGFSSAQISKQVQMHESNVALWRRRFREDGIDGLGDKQRPGGPETYDHNDRLTIAMVATSKREKPDGRETWTYEEIRDEVHGLGILVSLGHLWNILRSFDIRPHLVKGWLNRKDDPKFWERVQDICGLYLETPKRAVVFSIDEKTGVQATERKYPTTPAKAGRSVREEFEYVRHGTASLMTAFEVHIGDVYTEVINKNDSMTFCEFLADIESNVPKGKKIHVILDNGSSHTSRETKRWLKKHKRFVVHYTPPHASWVNQVELFFSIITRKVLKNNSFTSRDDLIAKIIGFINDYNKTAKPFKWTYDGKPLEA